MSTQTIVTEQDAKYSRNAYLKIVDDKVVFDCSDTEYGPIQFDLELLEEKIKQHKEHYGK
jgi:hypothetical protein